MNEFVDEDVAEDAYEFEHNSCNKKGVSRNGEEINCEAANATEHQNGAKVLK